MNFYFFVKVWSISINQTWSKCACKLTLLGHTDTVRCLVVNNVDLKKKHIFLILKIL